jgi:type II secretion system protein H
MSGGRRLDRDGFTLVELLVVLCILAIIATAVTISAGSANRQAAVDHAFEDLQATLHALSGKASISQVPVVVELAPGTSRIIGQCVAGDQLLAVMDRTLPAGVRVEAIELDGEVITDRVVSLLIQPSGYLRQMSVGLRLNDHVRWRAWDPVAATFTGGDEDA